MRTTTNDWSLKSAIHNSEWSHLEQTPLSARYQESIFTFRCSEGLQGSINTFITPDMEVSRLHITSGRSLLAVQDDGIERCVSTFVYQGYIQSQMEGADSLEQHRQQHSFVRGTGQAAGQHTIAAGTTSLLYINVKPDLLQALLPNWEAFTEKLYGRRQSPFFVSPALPVQPNIRMQQLLADLQNSPFSGITRSLHTEAKAMELLALQLDDLLKYKEISLSPAFSLSKVDREKLIALHQYITDNYLEPLSLTSLCRRFTLNEFKLKKGFRELYQQSVFNYILTLRMQQAKELLLSGDR
jgi:AraC family transcriptional regulator, transcriptional activator of the genes for pyochelin and ferripyochelin receptors